MRSVAVRIARSDRCDPFLGRVAIGKVPLRPPTVLFPASLSLLRAYLIKRFAKGKQGRPRKAVSFITAFCLGVHDLQESGHKAVCLRLF